MTTSDITPATRLIDLTVGDLLSLLEHRRSEGSTQYVYGLAGIASLFNCSIATAQRIKRSGVLDSAISQRGRTIVCDADKARLLFNNR